MLVQNVFPGTFAISKIGLVVLEEIFHLKNFLYKPRILYAYW